MAAKKPSMLKRERERARSEKAARKRENRKNRPSADASGTGPRVATRDELDGYGLDRTSSGDPFADGSRS